jgi:hypothetical protein
MKTCLALSLLALSLVAVSARPEAFEIGPDDTAQLPGGKEADGIIGDFVLRNDRIEAVISHNAPLRRANMSTFYGADGVTPGCLYDLTLRGANNDQIVVFTPSGQQGRVSWVRVAKDGSDGEAVVETVITAANNNGLYKRHEYRVRDGWQGVLITTTWRNEGREVRKGSVADRWTKFTVTGEAAGVTWADAEDPADKAGYAYDWMTTDGAKAPPREVTLEPGKEVTFSRFLAVGRSPAEAVGEVLAQHGDTARVRGNVTDNSGKPVTTAKVEFDLGGKKVAAYPDAKGVFELRLPAGDYSVTASDIGRNSETKQIKVDPRLRSAFVPANFQLGPAAAIEFDITDAAGRSIPCKAQFHGVDGTKNPDLGPRLRAHGCVDQYHSETGKFRVQVPPGDYEVIVTRGIEFSHLRQRVKVAPGKTVQVAGKLRRLVDTTGWISADFHNHSTPSGDNTTGTADRLINFAAEHIEFAPTTEHNRLFDWRPTIEKLGLAAELQTVPGMELTGSGAHFNSFPFTPEPFTQDNGAPVWNKDPRLNAINLRNHQGEDPNRWIQINHPDLVENFLDRNGDGRPDDGFIGLGALIDGYETQNYRTSEILADGPFSIGRGRDGKETVNWRREFLWLQLLNQGTRHIGVAVCDAHQIYGNGVGGWRMYFPSRSDEPAQIDWREISRHAKAGRSYLTTGPFLQVTTENGHGPGDDVRAAGSLKLRVRVQCTDWIDIDRVQVLVNGRQVPALNFTRITHPNLFAKGVMKFDQAIEVPLSQDSHIIVVAIGENFDLKTGYGTSDQARIKPCAYHNPIYVDVDGGGFKANGDTLGWPFPLGKFSLAEAKALLPKK